MSAKELLRRFGARRVALLGVVALLLLVGLVASEAASSAAAPAPIELQELVAGIDGGTVTRLELPTSGGEGVATFKDGTRRGLHLPEDVNWLATRALDRKVAVTFSGVPAKGPLAVVLSAIVGLLPLALMVFLSRSLLPGGGDAGFEWIDPREVATRFDDVAGADDAKEAMRDVVTFLKDPGAFEAVGARARSGVLLTGDPGNGKTLLARATAGEAGVGFMSVKGSEVGGIIVGAGARRLKGIFAKARANAPCIVFVDEIDAIAGRRYEGQGGAAGDNTMSVAQILTELDGLSGRKGVVIVAATNRPDTLDPAVTRPGRFDVSVDVPPPNLAARRRILELNAGRTKGDADVDLDRVARETIGLSGADLAALVNEAAIVAAKRESRTVAMRDYDEARLARQLGGRAGATPLSLQETEVVSVHEAGHAMAACDLEHCDPVVAATIAPRGRALGLVATSPESERRLVRRAVLEDRIVMLLAGRAAEEVTFGSDMATDGAASDMAQAVRLADAIVDRFGLEGTFDPSVALSTWSPRDRPVSDESRADRDREVRRIVRRLGERALDLARRNRDGVDALAARLREVETVDGAEVRAIHARGLGRPVGAAAQ